MPLASATSVSQPAIAAAMPRRLNFSRTPIAASSVTPFVRSDAETCTSRLTRLRIPGEHDDAARVGGAAESSDRTVRHGVAFLEPWLSLAGPVGSDERLDVGGGRDAAVVRDGVVEKGVGRVAGEGCEERADSFGLASTRRVVTKRFLDPA